ncbi:MAG: hypothetical protein JXB10_00515 [Pirellulales bacterium]|nr:hypothetical protein [Pirellulales bacterium]
MSIKTTTAVVSTLGCLLLLSCSGCMLPNNGIGPSIGFMAYPIPVSPYFQKQFEDEYHNQERYARMPVLGPIAPGVPCTAMDPPSDDEVMRALEDARRVQGGYPLLHEVQRNNVRIVVEPISDYVDPPRVYPLIGPAQLHHAHYKCNVYYTETTRVGWPIPYTVTDEETMETVYIDHDHLHMVGNLDPGPGTGYPENVVTPPQ